MSELNSYIVVFQGSSLAPDELITSYASTVEQRGGKVKHKYESRIMRGFAATMPEDLRKELEQHEGVKYVEPDGPVSAS